MRAKPLAPTWRHIQKGSEITHGGRTYVVVLLVELDIIQAQDIETGEKCILRLSTLSEGDGLLADTAQNQCGNAPPSEQTPETQNDPLSVSPYEWSEAKHWQEILAPMLSQSRPEKAYYVKAAKELNVSVATLYRRLANYKSSQQTTALLNRASRGGHPSQPGSSDVEPHPYKSFAGLCR